MTYIGHEMAMTASGADKPFENMANQLPVGDRTKDDAAKDPDPDTRECIPADTMPAHDARVLTRGHCCVHIELDGQVYTLRITRHNKLILTK